MPLSIKNIASIINTSLYINNDVEIEYLLIDSRKIIFPQSSLFFALSGPRRDGHEYIKDVYERGVRNFVVSDKQDYSAYENANFLLVDDVLQGLQTLAAYHRSKFSYPVIGITGSNGKTIVKEWLSQLLNDDFAVVRNPRSYNSQVGVPLSVWQMSQQHSLGIFEAGISTVGEMENLEKIIQPTIGILTNIGDAHKEGFASDKEKLLEKLKFFRHCKQLVYCRDVTEKWLDIEAEKIQLFNDTIVLFSWSRNHAETVVVKQEVRHISNTILTLQYKNSLLNFTVPFIDVASVDNCITCICTLLMMNVDAVKINQRLQQLQPVEMRLQLKKGINNCYILNDSYSNDLSSLNIALDYLKQQAGDNKTTVILSDILQSGMTDEALYTLIASQLQQRNIHRFIGIGQAISHHHNLFIQSAEQTVFYSSTEAFLQQSTHHHFNKEYILLKGARVFAFENISHWLEQKVHQTVMEINLSAMVHNLKQYQQKLAPSVKLMAMVKAFSYGSGSVEVARLLQFYKVDYLAVAYADEGVELRQAGISLPIMVMNVDEAAFDALIQHNLEPEIYSFSIYNAFHNYLQQQAIMQFPVHIKLNTGMNRLGFEVTDAAPLAMQLKLQNTMVVKSVFSHLVASENADHDGFTQHQALLFNEACTSFQSTLTYTFIKHIANSSGIFRHPNLQYDIVRLGIGLYGVDSANGNELSLEPVATLKTTIAQIRTVAANDSIGYNRRGVVTRESKIATLRIGYADGFSRRLGNGNGHVFLHGQQAPVIGNVCMDMVMIDVTDITTAKEGDEVEIFGKHLPIQKVAEWTGTIAYEIMTSISQRVKRVYVEE